MLSKTVVFLFTFLGIFALLLGTMPGELITSSFEPKYVNKEVKETFTALDVLMYDSAESGTIIYSDPPLAFSFGLPSGQYLEFDWLIQIGTEYIYLRHLVAGIGAWWYDYHNLELYDHNHVLLPDELHLLKTDIVNNWDSSKNASIFSAECPHIMTNVIFTPYDSSWTIGESWDNEKLNYTMSYQWNTNATTFSAFSLVAQLLTFQSPNLGIPGIGGTILNYVIAAPIWAMIAYLIFKFVAGIIPFISGGSGD